MHIHEMKRKIASLEGEEGRLKQILETLERSGNRIPEGRFRDSDGIEKYDEPDGVGVYHLWREGDTSFSIVVGEYMKVGDRTYEVPSSTVKSLEEQLMQKSKEIEQTRDMLAKAERKVEKSPATQPEEIDDMPLKGKVSEGATREDLETQLFEIERNHEFIRNSTALVQQSDTLLGKIRRLLGSKKILGFGDIQKKAEEIEKAIKKEKEFIERSGCKTYEDAVHKFEYGRVVGGEEVLLTEDYGPHDDYTRVVDKVPLERFDYACDEFGRELAKYDRMSKEAYEKMAFSYVKKDDFSQNLQAQVKDEIAIERDAKTEELLGLEVGSRLHDNWRAPRRKEDGTYEPRMKPTTDKAWIEAHGTDEVDIANTSFENLPSDWQYENLEAGKEAVDITESRTEMTPEELREASIKVHDAWCARKQQAIDNMRKECLESGMSPEEAEAKINEKYGWDMSLMVPFDRLTTEEQQKDTDHIILAMGVNRELESGELTKAQMAKKFETKSKGIEEI